MPPRSAKRKASAKRAKPTPKKPDLQSISPAEAATSVQPETVEQQKLPPVDLAATDHELDGPAEEARPPQSLTEELDGIPFAIEEPIGGLEDPVSEDTTVKCADSVMEDAVIVNDVERQGFVYNASAIERNNEPNAEVLLQNGENVDGVNEDKCVDGKANASEVVSDAGSQRVLVPEINSAVNVIETAAYQTNCDSNNVLVVREDCTGEGEGVEVAKNEYVEEDNEGNEDDEDLSTFINTSLANIKKNKNSEIYVGRLDKGTVEDDLIEVFGKFGELKSARIVRHPTTKKSKGFAFIQFASADHAKSALSELKDGVEVKGKRVKISASQENDTIYVGNICKTWSKENVLTTLKLYGIELFEEIHLPEDPKNDGKIKGFALLEFSTHSDAMRAFNRLRKPDAVFGHHKSAKVAFTQIPMHPSEEVLSQVKKVYLEGFTKDWNEEKVKEICSQYGEIVTINLFLGPSSKRKHFGFVTFTSREGALACVEGINKAHTGGELKASIAKPQYKGRLQKQGFRGGFKVEKQNQVPQLKQEDDKSKEGDKGKDHEPSMEKSTVKTKQAKRKSTSLSEGKEKALSDSRNIKPVIMKKTEKGIEGQHVGTSSKSEGTKHKRKKSSNVEDRRSGGIETEKPSKKSRGDEQGKQRNTSKNRKKDPRIRKGKYRADSTKHRNLYVTGYAASTANHQGHAQTHAASASASRRHYTDMEPHAGYLEPVVKLEPPHPEYIELESSAQLLPHAGYLEPAAGRKGQVHTRYLEHTVWTQSQAGYFQNPGRRHVESHAVYQQPALVQQIHDPYSPGLRRTDGLQRQGSSVYGYARVASAIPVSYVPNHTSYAGYQDGGIYYQNSGAYHQQRTYY